jgi:hypothetical protein
MATERARVVRVVVERVGSEPGHWCTRCALPSGWLLWHVIRHKDRMHMERSTWCDECGSRTTVVLGGAARG